MKERKSKADATTQDTLESHQPMIYCLIPITKLPRAPYIHLFPAPQSLVTQSQTTAFSPGRPERVRSHPRSLAVIFKSSFSSPEKVLPL